MFKNVKAFSSFAVKDLQEAKKFYGETLGLNVEEDKKMGLLNLHMADRLDVMIYPKEDHVPATFTILNFLVENIDTAVDELIAKGITCEKYEGFKQDEKGIARSDGNGPNIAWFKDPSGNILSIIEDDK